MGSVPQRPQCGEKSHFGAILFSYLWAFHILKEVHNLYIKKNSQRAIRLRAWMISVSVRSKVTGVRYFLRRLDPSLLSLWVSCPLLLLLSYVYLFSLYDFYSAWLWRKTEAGLSEKTKSFCSLWDGNFIREHWSLSSENLVAGGQKFWGEQRAETLLVLCCHFRQARE